MSALYINMKCLDGGLQNTYIQDHIKVYVALINYCALCENRPI